MSTLDWILGIVLVIAALIMLVSILMQRSQRSGLGAIAGGSDTYFGDGKTHGKEARLALITKISGGIFIAIALLMVILG